MKNSSYADEKRKNKTYDTKSHINLDYWSKSHSISFENPFI